MNNKNYIYFPFEFTILIILFVLFLLIYPLFFLIFAGGVVDAFARLGFSPITGTLVFLMSLFGSAINIPVAKITSRNPIFAEHVVYFYGIPYKIPFVSEQSTVIAVNFGGAVIPTLISIYEFLRILSFGLTNIALLTIVGIIIVSIVVHAFAKPIKGLGIAVPFFIPPIITAIVAMLLSKQYAPIIAYVSGTLGTLIGADLLNLNKVSDLGAPVVSIGGAGTFDGVFLTGILSTLLV